MIPAEAVEAAARAWVGEQVWQDCDAAWRADYLERARAILEAAAPHMLARAKAEALEDAADAAEDPSPEDMGSYFIDQADAGRWLRDRAAALRPAP